MTGEDVLEVRMAFQWEPTYLLEFGDGRSVRIRSLTKADELAAPFVDRDGRADVRRNICHLGTKLILRSLTHVDAAPVRWPISWWVRQDARTRAAIVAAFHRINAPVIERIVVGFR